MLLRFVCFDGGYHEVIVFGENANDVAEATWNVNVFCGHIHGLVVYYLPWLG